MTTETGHGRPMEVSVCVATFRRPEGLARLLRSLEAQKGAVPSFEVIVVDNDDKHSAGTVCEGFKDRLALRYLVEPMRGIARSRNRAVAASTSPFLAFIDDDEEASAEWLATHHHEVTECGADAAFGPVCFRFAVEPPASIRQCGLYQYPVFENGQTVQWYWTRTSNAFVRRASLPDTQAPFDVSLGLVGGEDVDLFFRMAQKGARFVAATEASVLEYRDASRTTLGWVIRRCFRNGGTLGRINWSGDGRWVRLRHGGGALLEAAACLYRAAVGLTRSRALALQQALYAIESLGRAAWTVGIVYSEYRRRA